MSSGGAPGGRHAIGRAASRRLVLAAATGTISMMLIDVTGVSVALPTIQHELGGNALQPHWIMNSYLLAVAALIAVGGRLADRCGRTRVFKAGLIAFTAASCAAGAAPSDTWLIAARAVQGAGAAAMAPAAMALVVDAYPPSERGRAIGIYTGISSGFLALGPALGGLLTEAVSWRLVFLVNVPIGLAVLIVAVAALPADRPPDAERGAERMDRLGTVTLVGGLAALVTALMQGPIWGWGSTGTIAALVGGLVSLTTFVIIEMRVRDPLLELRLFENRNFAVELGVLGAVRFVLMGLLVLGAIWLQVVLGLGPAATGVGLLVLTVPTLAFSPGAGRVVDRIGPRLPVSLGAAAIALGFAWFAAILDQRSYWLGVPGMVLIGVGVAAAMVAASSDSMNQAPAGRRGQAAGLSLTVREVGASVGLAAMVAIAVAVEQPQLDRVAASGPGSRTERAVAGLERGVSGGVARLPVADRDRLDDAFTDGVVASFLLAAGLMALSAALAGILLRHLAPLDSQPAGSTLGPAPSVARRATPPRPPGRPS